MVVEEKIEEDEVIECGANFIKFKEASLFQSSVIAFIVGLKTNTQDLMTLRKVFNKFDTNHDGGLSPLEIKNGLEQYKNDFTSLFGQDTDWDLVFKAIDTDDDGKIDYNEFITAASDRLKLINIKNLKSAFSLLDLNGDGQISVAEIRHAFTHGNMSDMT